MGSTKNSAPAPRKRLSPQELQAAKDAARVRYTLVADLLKKEAGVVRHYHHKVIGGLAWLNTGRILAPSGVTRRQLYVLAHECGHILLHRSPEGRAKPSHVKEHEAETYAHRAFARYGLEVPEKSSKWARAYVGQWVMKDKQEGVPICPMAVEFALGQRSALDPLPALEGQPTSDFSKSLDAFTAKGVRIAEAQERVQPTPQIRADVNAHNIPVGCGTCLFFGGIPTQVVRSGCKVHLMTHEVSWGDSGRCNFGANWRPDPAHLPPAPPVLARQSFTPALPLAVPTPASGPSFWKRLGDAFLDRVSGKYRLNIVYGLEAPPKDGSEPEMPKRVLKVL